MRRSEFWLTDTNRTVHNAFIKVSCYLKCTRVFTFDDHFSNSANFSVSCNIPAIVSKEQGQCATTVSLSLHASQANLNVLS